MQLATQDFAALDVPPMLLDPIFTIPEVAHFRALQMGALMFLCRAYWQGGAYPMPTDDTTLMLLSGLHTRQWLEQRERVLRAWRAIEPRLASVYAKLEHTRRAQREIGRFGAKAKKAKALARLNGGKLALDSGAAYSQARLVPQKESLKENTRTTSGDVIPKRVARGNAAKFHDTTTR
jgi:uncharacterized protein YdaU (DUF1376 family)